tara:strand:+ start:23301 stop:25121 length:1821 start_codon:yes stop_codon:yes gene_type:complete
MCGIAGYIGKNHINEELIHSTLDSMRRRGPDNQGYKVFSDNETLIYLLHTRLSIIDIDKRSNQPFSFDNCTLIYNGEIYNYIELKKDLQQKGYSFSTNSDTEVLLKSYLEYGEDCVNKFNGMWAFAIWDNRNQKLFLSRDRFAEKPLYYYKTNNGFYFGSEIKAIQNLINTKLEINYDHIKRYLVYGYKFLNKTEDTYFKNVKSLEHASNITIDLNLNCNQYKFWKPQNKILNMTLNDAIEGTKHHLLNSMNLRLRSDVKLAFCLSGGVDSASLASIAKKEFNYDVTTFSIIDKDSRYNESENIKSTIDDIGCKSYLIDLELNNVTSRLEDLINYHDSPVATISYLVHSMLSEKISEKGFKVAISGTSADELFTGYYDHFNLHLFEMRNHPDFNQFLDEWKRYTGKFIRNPYLKNPKLYFENELFREHNHLNSDVFSSFLIEDFSLEYSEKKFTDSLLRNRMLNELFHEATPVILHEDDLNSMMYSIENRSPFLDVNLFDFSYSIPNEHLIVNGYGKYVLREAVSGILNEKVRTDRRKIGFNASINSLINLNDPQSVDYLLSDSPIFDIIKKEKIEKLVSKKYFENSYKKFMFNFMNTKIFLEKFS